MPKFDLWGDTVNVSARMEYYGRENSIHLPEITLNSLSDDLKRQSILNGTIDVKGDLNY